MVDLLLDTSGDLSLTATGDLDVVSGSAAIAQRLQFTLRHFRGEWFLDEEFGVPWFQKILRKNPEAVVVEAVLKQAILATAGVRSLTHFSTSWDRTNRSLTVKFQVQTDLGLLAVAEVFV